MTDQIVKIQTNGPIEEQKLYDELQKKYDDLKKEYDILKEKKDYDRTYHKLYMRMYYSENKNAILKKAKEKNIKRKKEIIKAGKMKLKINPRKKKTN